MTEISPNKTYHEFDETVPMKSKVAYGLGTAGCGIMSGIPYAILSFFYNTKLGLDETYIAIGWIIFGVWNAINDPLFGFISDNTRSKLGRRIPYLRYLSFIYTLSFIACWYPLGNLSNQLVLFINFLVVLVVVDTFFSITGLCYFCLPCEMALTSKNRASIGLVGSLFNVIAVIIVFVVPIVLLTGDDTAINPLFRPVMIILGIISGFLIFGSSYFIKENKFAQLQETESVFKGFRELIKNKAFFYFEIANFALTLLTTIIQTGILYYIDYVVQLDIDAVMANPDPNYIFMVVSLLTFLVVGMFFVLKKIDVYGPRKIALFTFTSTTIGFIAFFFTGRSLFGSFIPLVFMIVGAIGGMIVMPVLIGDLTDNDELITGRRREGLYAGVNALITKPAISIANWAFLGLIPLFGFQSPTVQDGIITKFTQSDLAITGILFAFTILPAIFTFMAVLGLRKYPLDGPEWVEKKRHIKKLHDEKERAYLEKVQAQIKAETNSINIQK